MSFRLYEIEGGRVGEGLTFKGAVHNALLHAANEHQLSESLLPLGYHDLSRPEMPQRVNLSVRSEEEAVLAEIFPFRVVKILGGLALRGNEFRLVLLPPLGQTDTARPFIEPIFSMVQDTNKLKINLFSAIVYTPDLEGGPTH